MHILEGWDYFIFIYFIILSGPDGGRYRLREDEQEQDEEESE